MAADPSDIQVTVSHGGISSIINHLIMSEILHALVSHWILLLCMWQKCSRLNTANEKPEASTRLFFSGCFCINYMGRWFRHYCILPLMNTVPKQKMIRTKYDETQQQQQQQPQQQSHNSILLIEWWNCFVAMETQQTTSIYNALRRGSAFPARWMRKRVPPPRFLLQSPSSLGEIGFARRETEVLPVTRRTLGASSDQPNDWAPG